MHRHLLLLSAIYLIFRNLQCLEEIIVGFRRRLTNVENKVFVVALQERLEGDVAGLCFVELHFAEVLEELIALLDAIATGRENFGRLQDLFVGNFHDVVDVVESLDEFCVI